MTIADTAENPATTARSSFTAQIADESFQFRDVEFDDRKVTGAQIAAAAGAYLATDYVVLLHLLNHEIETVRPNELVDLQIGPRLFVIKGDGTERFFVDGLALEWPRKSLTGGGIKFLAGKDEDLDLLLEREDQPDKVIDDDDEVRIGAPGVEKFHTRPAQVKVTIIVNTRPKPWTKKRISFAEVVALAYPTPPAGENIVYTVGYFDGPPHRPEGSLTDGESVRVRDQMVFDVKFTDKS
ncbi:multiubiquitin domain-containing protein [Dongia sp.]|uniref:multiubiquitin domain-containing protein n=1 Tax=Dongia sp. TaxID=1977262 RepID=UPI0035AE9049